MVIAPMGALADSGSVANATQQVAAQSGNESTGALIYAARCASCHNRGDKTGGPSLSALRQMSSAQVAYAINQGKMREQARGIARADRAALVSYLTTDAGGSYQPPENAWCRARTIDTQNVLVGRWGIDDSNTRFQPASDINSDNVARLKLAWSFGLPQVSQARSQPVITKDTVFVLAVSGYVFALDRASGCVKWQASLGRPLRTSLSLGQVGTTPALFFGDAAATVVALNAEDGSILWESSVYLFDTSVTTGAPVPHGAQLFVPLSSFDVAAATNPNYECCKGHGAVVALDIATGQQQWVRHMTTSASPTYKSRIGVQQWGPSGVPVWTTPTIDVAAGRVYVGTGENTSSPATALSDAVLALDMQTGALLWSFQGTKGDAFNMACGRRQGPNCPKEDGPDFDFGASVIHTVDANGAGLLLAGQKSGVVYALNATDGAVRWQRRLSQGSALGGVHWGMALAGERLFVPIADPDYPRPGYQPKPGFHALNRDTGEVLWSYRAERGCERSAAAPVRDAVPWPPCPRAYGFSAAPMATNDLVFAGSLDGRLWAFAADNGAVLWQVGTATTFEAVNSLATHGGAIDNGGVQVADNLLLVSSGYGMFGQMPGNALLAYRLSATIESSVARE